MSLHKEYGTYIIKPYHILSYDSRKSDGKLPKIIIGKYCSIAHNCTFVVSNHLLDRFTTAPCGMPSLFAHGQGNLASYSKGDIIIKNDVWIGANCTLIDNITIGNGAVIAAGAVVTKDVPPYAVVGGNPAKIIKYRFSKELIDEIESLQFWELPIDEIHSFNRHTADISTFIKDVKKYMETKNKN